MAFALRGLVGFANRANALKQGYRFLSLARSLERNGEMGLRLVSSSNPRAGQWSNNSIQSLLSRYLSDSVVEGGKRQTEVATGRSSTSTAIPMGYADEYFHHVHRWRPGDPSKRTVVYLWLDVLAEASTEVSLDSVPEGSTVSVKWRGKPVFIRHRSEADIAKAKQDDHADLRDPQLDESRVEDPHWLVVIGICTHLGCIPIADAGDYGGWFCPCHGSHYDVSGRIRKGPAPSNLEIPPYKFTEDGKMIIG
ncbi:Cytochrome b-c1 complex subunit Rieske-3, mitochondrial [Galdieria sulphuraria]|nr:Cytochrome b-c1 complex subunit Rieske-3, mitochondrial [Galdieria sulphuraria]